MNAKILAAIQFSLGFILLYTFISTLAVWPDSCSEGGVDFQRENESHRQDVIVGQKLPFSEQFESCGGDSKNLLSFSVQKCWLNLSFSVQIKEVGFKFMRGIEMYEKSQL